MTLYLLVTPKWVLLQTVYTPDEMLHDAAFHQGIHCLRRQKQSSEKEMQYFKKNLTCGPWIYTMDHLKSIVSNQEEESIRA